MTITSMGRPPAADVPVAPSTGANSDAPLVADGFGALVAAHLTTLADAAEQDATDVVATAAAGQDATEVVTTPAGGRPAVDAVGPAADEVRDPDESEAAEQATPTADTPVPMPVPMPALLQVHVPAAHPDGAVADASPTQGEPARGVDRAAAAAADRAASDQGSAGHRPTPLAQVGRAGAPVDARPAAIVPGDADPGAVVADAPHPTVAAVVELTPAAGPAYVAAEPAIPEATPAGPAVPTGQANAGAVTSQVFPTVPALVSRGEGAHSITLRLHPADLGEVHVTVTVRDGAVQVTLAAGREAQEALRAGSGELRSLLDLAGASGGQVVVRDLPSGPAPGPPTTSGSFQLPTGQASTEGGADRHDRYARESGRTRADGPADEAASSGTTPRPQTRAATGLDLTL
jgi:flagellar hook-length control protein FliK